MFHIFTKNCRPIDCAIFGKMRLEIRKEHYLPLQGTWQTVNEEEGRDRKEEGRDGEGRDGEGEKEEGREEEGAFKLGLTQEISSGQPCEAAQRPQNP